MDITYASNVDSDTLKTVTFDGTTDTGATGDVPLFTVTGDIMVVSIVGVVTTAVTEGGATAEMSLGVTDTVNLFILITEPEDLIDNAVWVDDTPTTTAKALPAGLQNIIVNGDTNDILGTVTGNTVATGVMNFYLTWRPLSSNGLVVPV